MNCAQPGCGGTTQAVVSAPSQVARPTPDEDRWIELVDMANAIRPRTLT
jgi:hypothetical protein